MRRSVTFAERLRLSSRARFLWARGERNRALCAAWMDGGILAAEIRSPCRVRSRSMAAVRIRPHLSPSIFAILDTRSGFFWTPTSRQTRRPCDERPTKARPDNCSTEQRLFLDLPWAGVRALIALAIECVGQDSVIAVLDNALNAADLPTVSAAKLGPERDTVDLRRLIGKVANDKSWFKDISRGEGLASLVGPHLANVAATPLAQGLEAMRTWVDGS